MRIGRRIFEGRLAATAVILLLLIVASVGVLFASNLLGRIAYRCEPKIEKILPIIFLIIIAIQPLAIFRKTRALAGLLTWACSLLFGLWLGLFSVAVLDEIWGPLGIILGILAWIATGREELAIMQDNRANPWAKIVASLKLQFGGFVSLALFASAYRAAWNWVVILVVGIVAVFITRFISAMELDLAERRRVSMAPVAISASLRK